MLVVVAAGTNGEKWAATYAAPYPVLEHKYCTFQITNFQITITQFYNLIIISHSETPFANFLVLPAGRYRLFSGLLSLVPRPHLFRSLQKGSGV